MPKKKTPPKKTARKKGRRRGKIGLFWPIYIVVVAAALIAVMIVCMRLTPYLSDYERSNPKYAANSAMNYFVQGDMSVFYDAAPEGQLTYESRDEYVSWLSDYIQGGTFTYVPAYSPADSGLKKYAVRMNGEPFGAFYLREVKNSTEYGFSTWEFDHLEAPTPEAATYEVLAPSDATVFAGTQQLGPQDAAETGIKTVWDGFMLQEETQAPTLVRYRFSRYFGCPAVTASDSLGPCRVTGDPLTGFTVERNYDAQLQAQAAPRVETVVSAFSKFVANDLERYTMLKEYVRKGTKAYDVIQTFDNQWFGRHDSAKVTNLQTSDYIRFTDDTMACRIHYDFIVTSDKGEATYDTNYWFYFVWRNDEWYLYDFYAIL